VSSPRHARKKSCAVAARWNSRVTRFRHHKNVAVSWSTEQEDVNDKTTNSGDWIEVSRRRNNNAAGKRSRAGGSGKQLRYRNLYWRNHEDVTTFYFSRFPDGTSEYELWKIFQKWGRVKEVFIPKYKNKEGHRFGFVRFKEVMDETRLECDLDNNIFIDGMKLFVNRPKFDRDKVYRIHPNEESFQNLGSRQEKNKGKQLGNTWRCHDGGARSYLEVVKEAPLGHGSSYLLKEDPQGIIKEKPRSVVLKSTKEERQWLEKAWVGRLKNRGMFEKLEEELRWVFDRDINPCYWGDDWIILPGLDESNANKLINEELKNGSTPITELQKWSPAIRPEHRLTWVLLQGLPPSVWKPEFMKKVMELIGEMVEVDEYVEERKRMDVARTLVRTNRRLGFQENIQATIDGEEYELTVVEDMTTMGDKLKSYHNSSWFPPSPMSTQPNTPATRTDGTPGCDSGNDDGDAVFDDVDADVPKHWNNSRSPKQRPSRSRRDQWVKSLGRSPSDRSNTDADDVDQSKVVNGGGYPRVACGVDSELHNGHIIQSGKSFINEGDRQSWASTNIAGSSQKNELRQEGRTGQNYKEKREISDIDTEGDRDEVRLFEKQYPHRADNLNLKKCGVNFTSGQHVLNEDIGDMGQKLKGPIKLATKVYVIRKEVLLSHGKAQYFHGPEAVLDVVPGADGIPAIQGDKTEQELDLVRELGLTHGGDDKEIKETLLDMDNRDIMKAVEMGIKKQIL